MLVKGSTSPQKQSSKFGRRRERSAGAFDEAGSSVEEKAVAPVRVARERVGDVVRAFLRLYMAVVHVLVLEISNLL
jgi:hypothetical protein